MTWPRKNPGASGIRTRGLPFSRRTPYHKANEAVWPDDWRTEGCALKMENVFTTWCDCCAFNAVITAAAPVWFFVRMGAVSVCSLVCLFVCLPEAVSVCSLCLSVCQELSQFFLSVWLSVCQDCLNFFSLSVCLSGAVSIFSRLEITVPVGWALNTNN